jgi:adenylosuccinate synthase
MPVVIIVGAQWGDEGKGKVVDYLTEHADVVVRFQGGNNAGHTVIVDGKKTALSIIPSGILHATSRCLLASGVVLDPEILIKELFSLEDNGITVTPERLGISGEIPLIMPYHPAIDQERERLRQASKTQIGTTGKGIGPAYEDSVSRNAIRVADLADPDRLKMLVERNVESKNRYLSSVLDSDISFDARDVFDTCMHHANRIVPYITNVSAELARAHIEKKYVLFEGAQGSLLDIHHGTYPYVTSSSTVAGFACVSAGFSPRHVDSIVGIFKAYTTRVGEGPFPTEDTGEDGDRLRSIGQEFGTVTGRPRRCGWFDVVAAKKAIRINGIDEMFFVKLDVLTGFKKIKIGTHYLLDGAPIDDLPIIHADCDRVEVFYEELEGWEEDITKVRSYGDLPRQTRVFMERVSELVGVEISGFSVGPDRNQTFVTSSKLLSFSK